MKEQNFKNHSKWVPGYHFLSFFAIVILLVGSIRNLVVFSEGNRYVGTLLVLIAFILLFLFYFVRIFSLRTQDRVIRSEENFRHYLLTGRQLPQNLKMRQVIGLRFASDKEFPALVTRSVTENLSEKEIKKEIKEWKVDFYRV
ncbi:MAG: hypothetical protein COB98_03275 [Flavobacteriaceae bacterium]|nr:MAG: hypothetical protein COB98_03275 [Flavobacteriaceae bacterium]